MLIGACALQIRELEEMLMEFKRNPAPQVRGQEDAARLGYQAPLAQAAANGYVPPTMQTGEGFFLSFMQAAQ